MRGSFHDGKTGVEYRPEERCADLTDASAHPFDRASAVNDQRFGKTVIEADVSKMFSHGESFSGCHQKTVVLPGSRFNILNSLRGRAVKIGSLRPDQLGDSQLLPGSRRGNSWLRFIDYQRGCMLAARHGFIDRFDTGVDI